MAMAIRSGSVQSTSAWKRVKGSGGKREYIHNFGIDIARIFDFYQMSNTYSATSPLDFPSPWLCPQFIYTIVRVQVFSIPHSPFPILKQVS